MSELVDQKLRADKIKADAPESNVSTDAIFLALQLGAKSKSRPYTYAYRDPDMPPPEWIAEALIALQGRSLTIRSFLLCADRFPVEPGESRAVGRWLRDSRRKPYKSHGDVKFRI